MSVSAKIPAIKLNQIPIFAITTVSALVADNRLIPTIITENKSAYESYKLYDIIWTMLYVSRISASGSKSHNKFYNVILDLHSVFDENNRYMTHSSF